MVQHLTSEGNIRSLFRNEAPIGDIASDICRLAFILSMKKLYNVKGVSSIFLSWKNIRKDEYVSGLIKSVCKCSVSF
jgi:hypothetical protein